MHQSAPLRLATRRSPLAQWQARWVASQLAAAGHQVELVLLSSRGDEHQSTIDAETGGVGVFTKRIQDAVLEGEAEIAVHSMKDLPTDPQTELQIAAVPIRESVSDCLITRGADSLEHLPQGASIGTGSRRRAAQLLYRRPDLQVQPIRGNVETRLAKLHDGQFDAIVLAEAGLTRLQLTQYVAERLPLDVMLPAPGQGALAIETRVSDPRTTAIVAQLNDPAARACVTAERTLLRQLSGGCLAPIAALAEIDGGALQLEAVVLSADGQQRLQCRKSVAATNPDGGHAGEPRFSPEQAAALGRDVADDLLAQGAEALIAAAR